MSEEITGPVHKLIGTRQTEVGLDDDQLNKILGYESPTPLRLIKAGRMSLPISKVAALARALEVSAADLLELHLSERSPETLKAIHDCVGAISIAPHEQQYLQQLRSMSRGRNISIVSFRAYGITGVIMMDEEDPEGPLICQELSLKRL